MWVLPNTSTLSGVQMNYSYRVIVVDRVRKDESDEVDVESDTDLILKDCISYLYKYALQNELKLTDGITFNPVWEKWSDEVSGAYIDVNLEDYFDLCLPCFIPLKRWFIYFCMIRLKLSPLSLFLGYLITITTLRGYVNR